MNKFIFAIIISLLWWTSTASATLILPTTDVARYMNTSNSLSFISVGQGQAGWQAFDISGLVGPVSSITYSFTLLGPVNPQFFPLSMSVYDVTSDFADINVTRNSLDATGQAVLLDLHSGNTYAEFIATSVNNVVYNMSFNAQAVIDLNSSIGLGEQYFSIGIANTN